eukprot:GDKJ01017024.1.p1 GENE.GDKJ01017024.1~~GDKJ01017024.1.p1  ORF type:complete len:238 (+),score=58.49 GDKJ01017024.1:64-777(+)
MDGEDEYSLLIQSLKKVSEQRHQQRKKRGLEVIEKTRNALVSSVKKRKISHVSTRKHVVDDMATCYNRKEQMLQEILDECKLLLDSIKTDLKESSLESDDLTKKMHETIEQYQEAVKKLQSKEQDEWETFQLWANNEIEKAAKQAIESSNVVNSATLLKTTQELLNVLVENATSSGSKDPNSMPQKIMNVQNHEDSMELSPLLEFPTPDLEGRNYLQTSHGIANEGIFGSILNVDSI